MDLSRLDTIKINFIIGPGRSGTTLLVVLLNNLQNCISTPEIHHLLYFFKKYRKIQKVSPQVISDYKKYLNYYFEIKKSPLIGPLNMSLIDSLQIGQPITYGELSKLIYLSLYGEKGISYDINVIMDKNPYYTFHIDKIKEVFPEAKFLALIRDYRAYALSNVQSQKPWVAKKSYLYYAHVWSLHLRKISSGKKKYGDDLKIIKYEDLAINKEETFKEIMSFLKIDYTEAIFDFHIAMKEKIKNLYIPSQHERMIKKINDLSSPINSSRVYTWQQSLSDENMKRLEFVCEKIGMNYNYFPLKKITVLQKIKYTIIQLPILIRVKLFEVLNSSRIHFHLNYKKNKAPN